MLARSPQPDHASLPTYFPKPPSAGMKNEVRSGVHPDGEPVPPDSILPEEHSPEIIGYLGRFVTVACVFAVVIAGLCGLGIVLAGSRFQRIVEHMSPADVVCLLLLGISLWVLREAKSPPSKFRWLAGILAGTVVFSGILNLLEVFFSKSHLGYYESFGGQLSKLQPLTSLHPINALIVSLLGVGLLLLDKKTHRSWLFQFFPAAASIMSLLAILILTSAPGSAPSAMGLVNIAGFLALSLALLAARPRCGLAGIVSGANAGGFLVRRLLPAVVISQLAIAWVRGMGERLSLWTDLTATRLLMLIILAAIVVWTAVLVNSIDRERQRSTHAASISELRHQLLFENMLEGVAHCQMIFDSEQRPIDFLYLAVNSTFTRLTGLRDVVGKTVSAVMPGIHDIHPELFEVYAEVTRTGHPRKIEFECLPLARWFSIASHRAEPGQFVAVFEDITDRRKAEESTRELAAIVDSSDWAIISTCPVGFIRAWNNGATRLFGYCVEETRGKKIAFLDAPDAKVRSEEMLARALQGETIRCVEIQTQCKNGSLIQVNLSVAPIRAADGRIVGASFISRDITTQKLGEQHSRLLQAALSATANAVVITHRDGRIQWTNRAFTALTGYEAGEVLGKTPRILRSGEHPPSFYAEMWQTILDGRVWNGEVMNRRKDGAVYTEEMTITPIFSEDGEVSHFVAVKQDITQRKSLERGIRQAQKMEAIGTLAGGVAHDFNNLLGVIRAYCERLDAYVGDNADLSLIAEEIRAAVDSGAALTAQLLAFGRKQVYQPEVLSLSKVVSEAASLLHRVLGEDIVLTLQLSSEADSIMADPLQMQQIIMNLAVNSRDAMPKGGSLQISTTSIDCDGAEVANGILPPGCYMKLEIRDTGMGMDAATLQRAFEPFFTTKPLGRGTGLGLATVYGIVKQCGGNVYLSSSPGEGTVAEVYLPRVDAKPVVHAKQALANPAPGHETILVVEDFPALRRAIAKNLERNGYRVITAKDGNQALTLAALNQQPLDLVISDVVMPGVDGPELARRLAENHPRLQVLYISGYSDEMLWEKGAVSGGFTFIRKPFDLAYLLSKVREALNSTAAPNYSVKGAAVAASSQSSAHSPAPDTV